jgi:hypothetical protein
VRALCRLELRELLGSAWGVSQNNRRAKVALGVVEAINGNIKTLLRRGRGCKSLRYLLLKARRLAATRKQFGAFEKAA